MGSLMWCSQILPCLISLLFLNPVMICSLCSSQSPSSAPSCLPEESSALLQFINSLTPRDNDDFRSWNQSKSCCLWEGVTCEPLSGRVIGLDLGYRDLMGSIPKNSSLFGLHGLQWLNLTWNSFWDSTLTGFNQLVNLTHLDLSNSNFSGLVPSDISQLSKLITLDLSLNNLLTIESHSFDMLARNLTRLRSVSLDDIDMVDVAPTSLLNLSSSLELLSIRNCSLRGEFPSEIFHFQYLDVLDLSTNGNLTGYLPLSNWSLSLKGLQLSFCDFGGLIPSSLGNLTQLTSLDLSFNNFEGEIPSTLFNLTHLTILSLSGNGLDGVLPSHISGLQNLNEIHVSKNLLRGKVPSWLFSLPSLTYVRLSYNRFIGPIDDIQKLNSSLEAVYLDHNYIDGPIPTFLFDLLNIQELDLSSNNVSGVIKPDMLSKVQSLETLNISNNNLLSLSSNGSDYVNYTFPGLRFLYSSYCDIRQFPNFLRAAYYLVELDLSHNNIYGSVSNWDAEGWESLESLSLSYNFLTSFEQIPWKNLPILDLSWNHINSQFPVLSPSLVAFSISGNRVRGKIHPSICNLTSLGFLDISENSLDGIIPTCLANSSGYLEIVNFRSNNLQGNIPSFCNAHSTLQLLALSLNENQLEGLVPRSLMNCSALQILNVANNKLRGTFPHWLGIVSTLRVLSLRANRFHGPLPDSVAASSFQNLQLIDLSQNEFTGLLPAKFFQFLKAMKDVANYIPFRENPYSGYQFMDYDGEYSAKITMKRMEMELLKTLALFAGMDLSSNLFHGHIPKEVGELCVLQLLNLSHNSLTGPIPPSLGNIIALESLDLSSNMLAGNIPTQLTSLTFLEVLNLSYNYLEGLIPSGKQFNTFGNDSYIGNSGLCGLPLSKQCGEGPNPPAAPKFKKNNEVSSMAFTWKVAMMGYGCGMVLGVSMGYIVFTTGRPWWLVSMTERHLQGKVTRWINKIRGRKN